MRKETKYNRSWIRIYADEVVGFFNDSNMRLFAFRMDIENAIFSFLVLCLVRNTEKKYATLLIWTWNQIALIDSPWINISISKYNNISALWFPHQHRWAESFLSFIHLQHHHRYYALCSIERTRCGHSQWLPHTPGASHIYSPASPAALYTNCTSIFHWWYFPAMQFSRRLIMVFRFALFVWAITEWAMMEIQRMPDATQYRIFRNRHLLFPHISKIDSFRFGRQSTTVTNACNDRYTNISLSFHPFRKYMVDSSCFMYVFHET